MNKNDTIQNIIINHQRCNREYLVELFDNLYEIILFITNNIHTLEQK